MLTSEQGEPRAIAATEVRIYQEQAEAGFPVRPGQCKGLDREAAGAVVAGLPVAIAHVDDLDFAAAAGGVHEA